MGTPARSHMRCCSRLDAHRTHLSHRHVPLHACTATHSPGPHRFTLSSSAACSLPATDAPSSARPPPAHSMPSSLTTSCAGAWCCPAPPTWSWRAPRAVPAWMSRAVSCAASSSCSHSRSTAAVCYATHTHSRPAAQRLLPDTQRPDARRSTQNAHSTPPDIHPPPTHSRLPPVHPVHPCPPPST